MGRFRLVVLVLLAAMGRSQSQTQSVAPKPEFEVASIHPSSPNQRELNGFYIYPGGRILCKGCRLQYLIMVALDVQPYQISGGPAWTDLVRGESFEIEAKPPDSSPSVRSDPATPQMPPNQEQRQMLLSLLADRFQFRFHRTTKEGTIFILTRGKSPLMLVPPANKNAFPWAGGIAGGWFGDGVRGTNISMAELAARLSRFLRCPVLDRTGLKGSFDFEYRVGDASNDEDIPGTLRAAMQGIGLNLVSAKGPVETIVIDHVDQPSQN